MPFMESFFNELSTELKLGTTKRGHPFRYFSLATNGLNEHLGIRTVVLRKVTPELRCTFYSDKRSKKMEELVSDPAVSALFYHPKKLWQIIIKGKAKIENDTEVLKTFWNGIPIKARKDYTTQLPPGTPVVKETDIEYLNDGDYFTMVHIIPEQIEFLKLERPSHSRVLFSKRKGDWVGTQLVP